MSSNISRLEITDICDELSEDLRRELIEKQRIFVSKWDSNRKQFYELKDEIKRLKSDLKFANKCLITLNKFKKYLTEIRPQIENVLDFRQKQELNQLENEYQFMIKTFNEKVKIFNSSGSESQNAFKKEVNEVDVIDCEPNYYIKEEIIETNDDLNPNEFNEDLSSNQLMVQTIESNEQTEDISSKHSNQVKQRLSDKENSDHFSNQISLSNESGNDSVDEDFVPENECQSDDNEEYFSDTKDEESIPKKKRKSVAKTGSNDLSFICPIIGCDKLFNSTRERNRHYCYSAAHSHLEFDKNLSLECNECNFRCDSDKWMKRHVKIHCRHKCQFCETTLSSNSSLITHLKSVHSFVKKIKCSVEDCPQVFTSDYLRSIHLKRDHKKVTYSCDYENCDFMGKTSNDLDDHKYKHTGEQPFVCDWIGCGFIAEDRKKLYSHKYRKHMNGEDAMKFKCHLCDFRCKTRSYFKRHEKTHSTEKPFKCELCGKAFKCKDRLPQHMSTVHSCSPTIKCTYSGCQQMFKTIHLRFSHYIKEHGRGVDKFKCPHKECDFVGKNARDFEDHKYKHTGETPYVCDWIGCGFIAENRNKLYDHKYRKHMNGEDAMKFKCHLCDFRCKTRSYFKRHEKRHSTEKPFLCELCGKGFKSKNKLPEHMSTEHSWNPTLKCTYSGCQQMFKTVKLRIEHYIKEHGRKVDQFKCPHQQCNFVCKNSRDLEDHKNVHTGDTHYVCEHEGCEYVTNSRLTLNRHCTWKHPTALFQCGSCDNVYNAKQSLDIHVAFKHSDERPFRCDTCGDTFKIKRQLRNHQISHNPNITFKCRYPDCGQEFKTSHQRTIHHNVVHKKNYPCDWPECDHIAANKSRLEKHKYSHTGQTPFVCDWPDCVFVAKSKDILKHHKYRHTGERPYPCEWDGCDKSFRTESAFTTHMRLHRNDKCYSCEWPGCEFATHDRSHLRTHRFQHQKHLSENNGSNHTAPVTVQELPATGYRITSRKDGSDVLVISRKNFFIKKSVNKRNVRKPIKYEPDSDYSESD